MLNDFYPYLKSFDLKIFKFYSEGKNGRIEKLVVYQKIEDNYYNLAFGDLINNNIRELYQVKKTYEIFEVERKRK